jgi:SAM-dependent methyltransferase
MDDREALDLIEAAVPRARGIWADLGAGQGTFTRALAERLEPGARIYAVDRDARAVASLRRWASRTPARVIVVQADFTPPFELPELGGAALDGILLANALHFVHDADEVLARLASRLAAAGRVVLVEYERRAASRWVPHPIPVARLPELARRAGLAPPRVVATRPSAFGGALYAAVAERAGPGRPG